MSETAARLWDRFAVHRSALPGATIDDFLALELSGASECERANARAMLATALELEALRPVAPLVDVNLVASDLEFAGHRLLRELGRGAFGLVYEAVPLAGGPHVALKVLNPLATADTRRQRELIREAQLLTRLVHPGIVRVLASGVERGHAWFSSELVRGRALDQIARLDGSERDARATRLALELAQALAHAHARGVVHRDLKPSNVVVAASGELKVLDFGLARHDAVALSISASAEVAGTPVFMAPEQLRGGVVGARSDVFAIGLLIGVALDSSVVARLRDPSELTRRLRGRNTTAVRLRDVPAFLRPIVARCLEVDPRDRYADAGELAEDLESVASGERPVHGRPKALARAVRWPRRHPIAATLQLASLAIIAALVRELWWLAPVTVRIDSFDQARVLELDGRGVGVTPITLRLRPGRHTWRVIASGPAARGLAQSGEFFVAPRAERHDEFLLLDWFPPVPTLRSGTHETPTLGELEAVPSGTGAWVVLAVDAQNDDDPESVGGRIELEVLSGGGAAPLEPGTGLLSISCVTRFRLPAGAHVIRVSHADRGPRELSITIPHGPEGDRLQFFAETLDPINEARTTVTLYSHFDPRVASWIRSSANIRTFNEGMAFDEGQLPYVWKPYLGAAVSRAPTFVELCIPLDEVAEASSSRLVELDASFESGQNTEAAGWLHVTAGPSRERLETLTAWSSSTSMNTPRALRARLANGTRIPLDAAALDRLASSLAGAEECWFAWDLGEGDAGDEFGFVSALRSEGLPRPIGEPTAGRFLWLPSMRLVFEKLP